MSCTNQPDSTEIRIENGLIRFDAYDLYKQRAEEARDYLISLDVNPDSEQECKRTVATARKISDQLNQEKIRIKKTVLEPKDDAACANWGGSWRTPTIEEWQIGRAHV